jgi:hypothetical protein
MQTFLPYSNFLGSVGCLDAQRLNRQRVEAHLIINALKGESKQFESDPCVMMWVGYVPALTQYMRLCVIEWINRGFKNTMEIPSENWDFKNPPWLGDRRLHDSHKSNLLKKAPAHYSIYNWRVQADLPYFWPGSGI